MFSVQFSCVGWSHVAEKCKAAFDLLLFMPKRKKNLWVKKSVYPKQFFYTGDKRTQTVWQQNYRVQVWEQQLGLHETEDRQKLSKCLQHCHG